VPPFDLEPETWRGVDWPLLQSGFVTRADGRALLASASWDRTVKLWDVEPTEPESVLTIPLLGPATAIAWSPNGDLIAAVTSTQVAVLTASGNQ
jgi:WD40 repeat protein